MKTTPVQEKANSLSIAASSISSNSAMNEDAIATGRYQVDCYDKYGNLKWSDSIENLVTTGGKNDALDKYLAGSGYTAAWYLGLISSTGYTTGADVADTMASHGGWAEDQNYSNGTRVAPAFSAAAAGSKTTSSAAAFNINSATTIKGCFLTTGSAKGGTTGILYSAGLFTGGDKAVSSGDTLNVSYTASL